MKRTPHLQTLLLTSVLCAAGPSLGAPQSPQNLVVLYADQEGATLAWDHPDTVSVASFQIRLADAPGGYRSMTDWNGHESALSFMTDDGRRDNLGWASVCAERGVAATIFCVPDFIGDPGYLTADEVRGLDSLGMEIGSHTMSHARLVTDKAFHLRYVGPAEACSLRAWGGFLETYVWDDSLGFTPDLDIDLNGPATYHLYSLADSIDRCAEYECVLDFYVCVNDFCRANRLQWVQGVRIEHDWYQAYTTAGVDSLRLAEETGGAKEAIEALIARPGYVCRSLAFPYHLHDQREMAACVRAGYLGARDGAAGTPHPWGSPHGPDDLASVNLFEKAAHQNGPPNSLDEEATRGWVRTLVEGWNAAGLWATLQTAHTYADIDSAHLAWALDEVIADGGVWVASFGDVAEYVRHHAINVAKPPRLEAYVAGLEPGETYYAVATALDAAGNESVWSNEVVFTLSPSTGIGERTGPVRPAPGLHFVGSTPSPGRAGTMLWFSLDNASIVDVYIYNVEGREVGRIGPYSLPPGLHSRFWGGVSLSGRSLASGRYYALFRDGSRSARGSLLLIR